MAAKGRVLAHFVCALLAFTFVPTPSPVRAASSLEEYQIKAAYILNFARFIEWPDSISNRGPIIVGLVGGNPFGEALESALSGKTVRGRPFSIRRFRSVQEIDECHMLFVTSSEASFISAVVQHFSKVPVLTISDARNFIEAGGGIGFVVVDNRVRFDINLRAIASARLKPSAQLLEVAHALQGSLK